jgi:trk system potassium uptake protein
MNWGYILGVIGAIVFFIGLSMAPPLAYALLQEESTWRGLALSMATTMGLGLFLHFAFRRAKAVAISHREGMAIVTLGWVCAGMAGALPFLSHFPSAIDALFESFSGFTTTGASILTDIESLPRSILLWRSLTHWLGGMGIIVLSLAILPFLGVGGMQLYKAEVSGPVPDKLRPRIRDTAILLWKVYLLFTVAQTVLLLLGGMDLFDALCHTFGTVATGGFSTKNASVGHFDSAYIDGVITFFMFICGINFALHYQMLRGRPLLLWRDPEFRFFGWLVLVFTMVAVTFLYREYGSLTLAFRYGIFQVVSILTTTGFATADYGLWAPVIQAVLLICMFVGGSAGSTAGGIKCMRIMLLAKQANREIMRLIHPHSVSQLKMGGRIIKPEVLSGILGFFILFMGLFVVSSFLLAAMGVDVLTAFAAVAANIGNIGPGLGGVGPAENYGHLPQAGKVLLSMCMLLGRLEIYTVILLFVPEFWRK